MNAWPHGPPAARTPAPVPTIIPPGPAAPAATNAAAAPNRAAPETGRHPWAEPRDNRRDFHKPLK